MNSRRAALRRLVSASAAALGLVTAGGARAGRGRAGVQGDVPPSASIPERIDAEGWRSLFARAAATGQPLSLPAGDHQVADLVLPTAGRLTAEPAAVFRNGGAGEAVLIVPDDRRGLQSTISLIVDGVNIDADVGGRRAGTGMLVRNTANVSLDHVTIRGGATGLRIAGGQFIALTQPKLQNNGVGLHCRPVRAEGGSNSLTLVHPIFVNNTVGMLIDNSGNIYGQGDIVLLNPQFLANTHCAVAVIGLSARVRTQLYITGFAPEANGRALPGGVDVLQVESHAIPRCSLYARFAQVSISDGSFGEYASTDPCMMLECSTLNLRNVDGYGGPSGVCVSADANSDVVISGSYGVIGVCHGVTAFRGHLAPWASQGTLAGPIRRYPATHIANRLRDAGKGDFEVRAGAVGAVVSDSRGRGYRVRFAARAGSSENNAARLAIPDGTADRLLVRVELEADRDTRLRIATYPNDGAVAVSLRGGEPTLACYWVNDAPNPAGLVAFSPADTAGATVVFRNVHVICGSLSSPQFRADCDALCAGGFNPADTG